MPASTSSKTIVRGKRAGLALVCALQLSQALARGREVLERVLDRAAVLALESRYLCQSVFNLGQPLRRERQAVEKVAQCRRQVFEHGARRAETFEVVFIRGL